MCVCMHVYIIFSTHSITIVLPNELSGVSLFKWNYLHQSSFYLIGNVIFIYIFF